VNKDEAGARKVRITVSLDPWMMDWLQDKVRRGEAASVGHAIRQCIMRVSRGTESEKEGSPNK